MGGKSCQAKDRPYEYLLASAMAAAMNYPLWRASAVGQSGFRVASSSFLHAPPRIATLARHLPSPFAAYLHAFAPPYRGVIGTILGMTWARAAIFWGSDRGKDFLKTTFPTIHSSIYTLLPPLLVSVAVQCVNQPVVRASITLQNPDSNLTNIRSTIQHIYQSHGGICALWHGTSAGILKTVPKYCTAIIVKDYMDTLLQPPPINNNNNHESHSDKLVRSALKSAVAGVAGAALTNPLDVIRNEMFKTNLNLIETVELLRANLGWKFVLRGMGKNLVAVSIPVASTIFFTDALIQFSIAREEAILL